MDNHIDQNTKKRIAYKKAKGDLKKLKDQEQEQAQKETDEVMRAGQDNPKLAAKEVKKIEEQTQKEEKIEREQTLNTLDMKKRFASSYKTELAKTLSNLLSNLDWIRGWVADVVVTSGAPIRIYGKPFETKDGILLVIKTAKGNIMHRGMLVTGEPPLDYAGLYNLCLQAENTMDKARGLLLGGDVKPPDIIKPNGTAV